jgi:hypothetical protein
VRISLHKHEHLEALISEENPLSSEAAFARGKILMDLGTLNNLGIVFQKHNVKM